MGDICLAFFFIYRWVEHDLLVMIKVVLMNPGNKIGEGNYSQEENRQN